MEGRNREITLWDLCSVYIYSSAAVHWGAAGGDGLENTLFLRKVEKCPSQNLSGRPWESSNS